MLLTPVAGGRLEEIAGVDGCREHADVRWFRDLVRSMALPARLTLLARATGAPPPDFSRAVVRSVEL